MLTKNAHNSVAIYDQMYLGKLRYKHYCLRLLHAHSFFIHVKQKQTWRFMISPHMNINSVFPSFILQP